MKSSHLVSRETFSEFISALKKEPRLAVDCETTGLYPYGVDHIFSVVFAGANCKFYCNFNSNTKYPEILVLGKEHVQILQKEIFDDPRRKYFFHNAKFDMAFLKKLGISCVGHVHDTKSVYRLINNEAFLKFSLENCAASIGHKKNGDVEAFIAEHELWHWQEIPGKEKREKKKYYDQVPLDLMLHYALQDAFITYELGCWQLEKLGELEKLAENKNAVGYRDIYTNEISLTKTVFEMESRGVLLDTAYCKNAIEDGATKLEKITKEFEAITGKPFKVSPKLFEEVFREEKFVYGAVTPTGKINPSFSSEVLETFKNPAAKLVLDYRDIKTKRDFFQGFLFYADENNVLHTNFNQDGTATGRFSSSNPNLQNLEKSGGDSLKEEFVIRRAIVPRPDYFFAMFDYDQVEYRLMLDEAESKPLIKKIIEEGLDVHQATANLAKISREQAKTTNFAVLFGSGLGLLSTSLGCSVTEAARIRNSIFEAAPEIEKWIDTLSRQAEMCGHVVNWFGRRCYFPNKKFAYKAINYRTQGGCADIMKIAMNQIHKILSPLKSKMILTIHDEIVIEVHKNEKEVLPRIKEIMEKVYPYKHLPLTVGVEHSFKSLADKVDGFPL